MEMTVVHILSVAERVAEKFGLDFDEEDLIDKFSFSNSPLIHEPFVNIVLKSKYSMLESHFLKTLLILPESIFVQYGVVNSVSIVQEFILYYYFFKQSEFIDFHNGTNFLRMMLSLADEQFEIDLTHLDMRLLTRSYTRKSIFFYQNELIYKAFDYVLLNTSEIKKEIIDTVHGIYNRCCIDAKFNFMSSLLFSEASLLFELASKRKSPMTSQKRRGLYKEFLCHF